MKQERIALETKGMLLLADSIQRAANAQKALAKATLAAAKAAKGALAAFDELNVLETKATSGAGGSTSTGASSGGQTKPPPLPPLPKPPKPEAEDISAWEELKLAIDRTLEALAAVSAGAVDNKEQLGALYTTVEPLLSALGSLASTTLELITTGFLTWWEGFTQLLLGALTTLLGLITGQWQLAWQGLCNIFAAGKTVIVQSFALLWEEVKAFAGVAVEAVKLLWQPVSRWFMEKVLTPLYRDFGWLWDGFRLAADLAFRATLGIWEPLAAWFTKSVVTPVTSAMSRLWSDCTNQFNHGSGSLLGTLKQYTNKMLEMFEVGANFFVGLLNGLIRALNSISIDIPDWVPKYGGSSFGIAIPMIPQLSVPRLATGAVIPPNAEFAAILGDQTRGRNLEAPEGLLREIVREEGSSREIVIRFEGSMAQLVRMLKPELELEDKRCGAQLIIG